MSRNTEPSVPRRSVDPFESLDERLTTNVSDNIGPARYFDLDENGNPVEDWSDVFSRVAKNIAVVEAVHYDYPISVGPEILRDDTPDDVRDDLFTDSNMRILRDLDEEISPYVDYDALIERAPPEVENHVRQYRSRFEEAMREQRWMPNSPTLMNAGTELQQLSACFVDSPTDSMDGIFGTATEWGLTQKTGGGIGGCFHRLRPKGARVSSTGGISSGPLSFMNLFDTVGETVKQGGRRRGAQMAIMHTHHPDIGRFCVAKRGEDALTNFNISVGVTDEFIEAVQNDDAYILEDPQTGILGDDADQFDSVAHTVHFYDPSYEDAWNDELDKPGTGPTGDVIEENFWRDYQDHMQDPDAFDEFRDRIDVEVGEPMELPAQFIWQLIVDGAHNNGEPGCFAIDEANRDHSFDIGDHPEYYQHATNPCAEQNLSEYEACNLGHVNLSLIVEDDAPTLDQFHDGYGRPSSYPRAVHRAITCNYLNRAIDWDQLDETIDLGVRFLDNVVTQSKFPLESIEERVQELRKIGLGIMGFHQLLIQLGIEYGSNISFDIAEELMGRIDERATEASHELARERGSFESWNDSKYADPMEHRDWFRKHCHDGAPNWEDGYPIRNHNVTTVAPTGTTSMIADTTGGIEPIYQVAYYKNVGDDIQGDDYLIEFDSFFLDTLEHQGIDVETVKDEATTLMQDNEFSGIESLSTVPDNLSDLFVTAGDLTVDEHIRIQSAFQTYTDSGISKTCNIRNDATIEDVSDALLDAIDRGIKGVTVYRKGSRQEEVKKENVDSYEDSDFGDISDSELIDLVEERATEDNEFRTNVERVANSVPLEGFSRAGADD